MVTCCKDCQERAINCHSACEKYKLEVEKNRIDKEQKRKFNEGHVAVVAYKRNHYKAVDRRNSTRESQRRKKWLHEQN